MLTGTIVLVVSILFVFIPAIMRIRRVMRRRSSKATTDYRPPLQNPVPPIMTMNAHMQGLATSPAPRMIVPPAAPIPPLPPQTIAPPQTAVPPQPVVSATPQMQIPTPAPLVVVPAPAPVPPPLMAPPASPPVPPSINQPSPIPPVQSL